MAETGARTYAEISDIERLIGDIVSGRHFDTGTFPTAVQVAAELDNAAADLNRELEAAGYTVPVAESYVTTWEFLKAANAYGAAALLLATIPSDGFEPADEIEVPGTTRAQTYENRFKSAKKAIREHRITAAMTTNRLGYMFAGSQEDEDGNEKKPIFTRGMDDYPGRRSLTESD